MNDPEWLLDIKEVIHWMFPIEFTCGYFFAIGCTILMVGFCLVLWPFVAFSQWRKQRR